MGKSHKERIAFEVLMILLSLVLFCLITRLWPLLFLVIPGILIAALRMLAQSAKRKPDIPASADIPQPPRPDTEQDVIRIAFGILQRRVTEQVVSRYPAARWVWEVPNAIERFTEGPQLTILLSRAGGFRRAIVQVNSLQFRSLVYETTELSKAEDYAEPDPGHEETSVPDEAVDYALIAFQWVESNLLLLNNRCNDLIAEGLRTMLIPACDLPHPDSWQEVCEELTRNGFAEASAQEGGIRVELPE